MAQILDLGKIRFNWAGTYNSGSTYEYNDLVKYGPNLYAYTATNAGSGIVPTNASNWVVVTEGVNFRGTYAANTLYYKNDIVFDGTSAWIVINQHTSNGNPSTGSNANVSLIALGQPGLPSSTNNANKLLTTDGSNAAWTDVSKLTKGYFGTSQGGAALTYETNSGLTDTATVFAKSTTGFAQVALVNPSNGAVASADFIAYTADGNNDSGWIDMGITSNNFSAANFGITGPHDGYIFMSAPRLQQFDISKIRVISTTATATTTTAHGYSVGNVVKLEGVGHTIADGLITLTAVSSTTFSWATTVTPFSEVDVSPFGVVYKPKGDGNLVFATDKTGLSNSIVFAAGGYESGTSQMRITPNDMVEIHIESESTSNTTGALTLAGGIGVLKNGHFGGDLQADGKLFVGPEADDFTTAANLTDPIAVLAYTGSPNSYAQVAIHNSTSSSSADILLYPNNGTDASGWVDLGITGSTFSQSQFSLTGPNDGYIFMEAPQGTSGKGNLVLATGNKGTQNRIIFGAGGFISGRSQMEIIPDNSVKINIATASTSATTGALVVNGGVGITGDVNIAGNITFGGTGTNVSTANLAVNAPLIFTGSGSIVSSNDLGLVTEGLYTVTNVPVVTVINKELNNNVAILTSLTTPYFAVGDSVTVANLDATFNGTYTVTAVDQSAKTFRYAKVTGNIASTTIGKVDYTVTNKSLNSNVATITTSTTHAMTVGTIVTITNVDSTFNGVYTITAVTSNTFSFAKTASNVTSTAATGTATYYTSVSTAAVSAATRTRWSGWTKKSSDGVWNLVSNISTIPTNTVNYSQNSYGNGVDLVYDKLQVGGIVIQGSGSGYGAPYGSLVIGGNISSPAWTTTGIRHVGSASSTLTDTTSTGTVAAAYTNTFGSNVTIAASNATTYTDYANAFFGAPAAGTNVTLTNAWSILTSGAVKVGTGLTVAGNTTLVGTLTGGSASDIAINTNKFTVTASSGNTAIAGTLGVTGLTTLTGGLAGGSTSDITINTNKFTVAAATGNTAVAGTLGVTGNTTVGGTLTVTGLASFPGGVSVTGTERFTGRFDVQEMREDIVSVTLAANVLTCDYTAANIYYSATAPSAAWTINLTNTPTDDAKAISISVLQVQGATGYVPTTFQIDGSSQTIKWAGGTVPTPTSTSGKLDIFNFSILRVSNAWQVLGSANLNY
jgi:hypothetical protein